MRINCVCKYVCLFYIYNYFMFMMTAFVMILYSYIIFVYKSLFIQVKKD